MLIAPMPIRFRDYGMTEGMIGVIFGAFYVACVLSRLAAPRLAGGMGEAWLLKAAILAAALGNAMMLAGDGFALYLSSRFVNGVGVGAATAVLVSMASAIVPQSRLGEGIGRLAMGGSISLALGPTLGMRVDALWGYRALLASTCLALAVALAAAMSLSDPAPAPALPPAAPEPPEAPAPPDAPEHRGPDERAAAAPAAEDGGAPARAWRGILLPALLTFLLGGSCCGIFNYLVLYLAERGVPGAETFFLLGAGVVVMTRLWAGRLHDTRGHSAVVGPSCLFMIVCLVTLLVSPGPKSILVAAVFYGLGMGALYPSLQALAIAGAPRGARTLVAAFTLNGYDVGIALNAAVLGWLSGVFGTYRTVYAVTPFLMVALFIVYTLSPAFDRGRKVRRTAA
jgi:predicted MFS family arabinose efflux permease